MKPMEAVKTAEGLSNKQAQCLLKAMHNDYTSASGANPQEWLRLMIHKNDSEKVVAVYEKFLSLGKDEFWKAIFKRAVEINRNVAAVYGKDIGAEVERAELEGRTKTGTDTVL